MTTQDVVEALLNLDIKLKDSLRAAHVLNDFDRNWGPKQHPELNYIIKHFLDPHIIVVISTQIHVYIIGEKEKRSSYFMINIEGFNSDFMVMKKNELTKLIKDTISKDLFIPKSYCERLIYMDKKNTYIFNRQSIKGTLFTRSEWTMGTDIYDMEISPLMKDKKLIDANQILNAFYEEF